MNKLILITIFVSTMGLFDFFKKKEEPKPESSTVILGMILLEEANSLNIEEMILDLEKKWNLKITDKEVDKEASILDVNGYKIAIGNVPAPIPGDEVETAAAYNYFWTDAAKEAIKHKGHIILSIMDAGKNAKLENILFNQIAASILEHSKSIGIYIGARTLVLEKNFYLDNTESMSADDLPLFNWIYFGLREDNGEHSIYTYGMTDFGKKEMEILNSKSDFNELSEMMFNLAHYVIAFDVVLKDGETIGMSAEQKLQISESKSNFLEGTTLKIKY